jgi:hypothetical protein
MLYCEERTHTDAFGSRVVGTMGAVSNLVVNKWNDIDKLCSTMILQCCDRCVIKCRDTTVVKQKLKNVLGK